jgi:hypothetical protein
VVTEERVRVRERELQRGDREWPRREINELF